MHIRTHHIYIYTERERHTHTQTHANKAMTLDGPVEDTVLRLKEQSERRQQQIQARREANVVEKNPLESVQVSK